MPGGESRQINDGGLRATESGLRHFQNGSMKATYASRIVAFFMTDRADIRVTTNKKPQRS